MDRKQKYWPRSTSHQAKGSISSQESECASARLPYCSNKTNATVAKYCDQTLDSVHAIQALCELFSQFLLVPSDFLDLSVKGMKHLQQNGRTNVIYSMSKALGTLTCSF